MRNGVFVAMLTLAGAMQAQAGTARPYATVRIGGGAVLPPRDVEAPVPPVSYREYREYRVDRTLYADRSAHSRAVDEMNAINNRRPRTFRFRPVMALTFDAADLDGPARMSGIAPNLMGMKPRHR